MKEARHIGIFQLIGFGAVSLAGTLLHFLYDWTGSPVAAVFSAVNESTWEHMKLLFFPMLFFAIAEYFILGRDRPCFWCIKLTGTVIGVLLIPILFYTLRGAFGSTPDWMNIAIFFLAAAVALLLEVHLFQKEERPCPLSRLCLLLLCLLAIAFALFTFFPPEIPLFEDPLGGFGI